MDVYINIMGDLILPRVGQLMRKCAIDSEGPRQRGHSSVFSFPAHWPLERPYLCTSMVVLVIAIITSNVLSQQLHFGSDQDDRYPNIGT